MAKEVKKKLRVGWYSFSCCEDSTIMFTEILNDHYKTWLKLLDFRDAKILRRENKRDELDVAFVEGAINSPKQAKELKAIRSRAKKLVAIGSCAVTGMPTGHRNTFDEKTLKEIKMIIEKFKYGNKVQKLDEVVTVDAKVPGCPMITDKFIDVLNQTLKEFNVG